MLSADDVSKDQLERVKKLRFYQKIDLPDGSTTSGRADHRREPAKLGLDGGVMQGKSLLDVAANDGFWAFWAEQQGASRALGIDVERYEHYDWGGHGVPEDLQGKPAKNENFDELKALFDSKVEREHVSVYDLDPARHGTFDVTVCYGLLYHLRHPLLAIDKMWGVTDGALILKTHTVLREPHLPYEIFFLDDVFDRSVTNWTGASEACVVHWMRDAGFRDVFVEKRENPQPGRNLFAKIYVGCVSDEFKELMQGSSAFRYCDDAYYGRSRRLVEDVLYGTPEKAASEPAAPRGESRPKTGGSPAAESGPADKPSTPSDGGAATSPRRGPVERTVRRIRKRAHRAAKKLEKRLRS